MTFRDVPDDKIIEPPLQMLDFVMALEAVRPSVGQRIGCGSLGLGDN